MEYVAGIAGIAVGAFSFMGMQSLGGESPIGMVDYIEIGCSDTTPLKVFAAVAYVRINRYRFAGGTETLIAAVFKSVVFNDCGFDRTGFVPCGTASGNENSGTGGVEKAIPDNQICQTGSKNAPAP